jgi:hypothetical protein
LASGTDGRESDLIWLAIRWPFFNVVGKKLIIGQGSRMPEAMTGIADGNFVLLIGSDAFAWRIS